jgi:magnesium transporter
VIVDAAVYERGRRVATEVSLDDVARRPRTPGSFLWIGMHEPTEAEFDAIRHDFGLHPLAIEDAVEAHQRPKLEVYDDALFLVLKTARYDEEARKVDLGELLIFVGGDFVVVVRHGAASALSGVRADLELHPDQLALGPAAVLHAILDRVVDDYTPVMDAIDDDIDELEASVFSDSRENPVERIYLLKREVLAMHRALPPLLEPLARLATKELPHVPPETRSYFRDVEDHLIRISERNDSHRDLLTSVLEANLTRVSVRQNEDMRKISAWVAIAVAPTAIAGIYGMNFEHMPELDTRYGYFVVLAVMAAVCTTLYRLFRRSGWL